MTDRVYDQTKSEAFAGRMMGVLNNSTIALMTSISHQTRRVIAGIQTDGTCWCGETIWQGQTAMRISVSSWATTEADVDRSLEAMLRVASE